MNFIKAFIVFLPWFLKRRMLNLFFGYSLHPKAKIGFAWIFPKKLIMEPGATIAHFTVAIHIDKIEMKENSKIGRSNWITGFPSNTNSKHFSYQTDRKPELLIGESSSITKNHHLDCTNQISIGRFSTIAGYRSQLLTHSINVFENRQESMPIKIGDYVFIATNVVILGGASLPSYSVLGAKALLNKSYVQEWMLYGGVPALPIKEVAKTGKYFSRTSGFIY